MKLWEGVANAFRLFFSEFSLFCQKVYFFHPLNRNDLNPFMPSPHNNIKPPHANLSEFDIADLTFGTSCQREWMIGSRRSERPVLSVRVDGWESTFGTSCRRERVRSWSRSHRNPRNRSRSWHPRNTTSQSRSWTLYLSTPQPCWSLLLLSHSQ